MVGAKGARSGERRLLRTGPLTFGVFFYRRAAIASPRYHTTNSTQYAQFDDSVDPVISRIAQLLASQNHCCLAHRYISYNIITLP